MKLIFNTISLLIMLTTVALAAPDIDKILKERSDHGKLQLKQEEESAAARHTIKLTEYAGLGPSKMACVRAMTRCTEKIAKTSSRWDELEAICYRDRMACERNAASIDEKIKADYLSKGRNPGY